MCPGCNHRVQPEQDRCSNCGIPLIVGAQHTRFGGTYAVRDTAGVNPRLFLLILVLGIAALMISRVPGPVQDLLATVNRMLHGGP
jgi:hypothetical protein